MAAIQRLEQGISIAEVARALEVNCNVLRRWRKEFRQGPGNAFPGQGQRRWSEGRIAHYLPELLGLLHRFGSAGEEDVF